MFVFASILSDVCDSLRLCVADKERTGRMEIGGAPSVL